MIIIIFSYNGYVSNNLCFLHKNNPQPDKYEFIILRKFNRKYFTKAHVIIPFGIKSQTKLYDIGTDYPEFKDKFLVSSKNTYTILDDKILFYETIEKYGFLKDSPIKLINSYTKNYKGQSKNGQFIIKHRDGVGSLNNRIIEGNIYNIIQNYHQDYQIQDVLTIYKIYGISCVCKNGSIISGLNFISGAVSNKTIHSHLIQQVVQIDDVFMNIISKIIKEFNYNGLIEFEFLEDTNGQKYLMECNPRISGNVKTTDLYGKTTYINHIIYSYCDIIFNNQMNNLSLSRDNLKNDYKEITDIVYHGDFQIFPHRFNNDDVLEFYIK